MVDKCLKMKIHLLLFAVTFFSIDLLSQEMAIYNAFENKVNINLKNKTDYEKIHPILRDWKIGFNYGITQFNGDIRQYSIYPSTEIYSSSDRLRFSELRTAFSFLLNKRINEYYSFGVEILSGHFAGLKRVKNHPSYIPFDPYDNFAGYGEKFITSFKEFDCIANFNLNNLISNYSKSNLESKLLVSIKLGVGINISNVIKTNIIKDNYIFTYGYEKTNPRGTVRKPFLEQLKETVYIYGISIEYPMDEKLDLCLDYTIRNGYTDKWDATISDQTNFSDQFAYLSLGISYKINYNLINKLIDKQNGNNIIQSKSNQYIIDNIDIEGLEINNFK